MKPKECTSLQSTWKTRDQKFWCVALDLDLELLLTESIATGDLYLAAHGNEFPCLYKCKTVIPETGTIISTNTETSFHVSDCVKVKEI